jgi:hypothetical protein
MPKKLANTVGKIGLKVGRIGEYGVNNVDKAVRLAKFL